MTRRERLQHFLRANVAGGEALAAAPAARILYQAGGKHLLSEATQSAVRELSERSAAQLLARAVPEVERLAQLRLAASARAGTALEVVAGSSRVLGREAARAAGKQVLRSAGKAAGFGLLIDGVVGGAEAILGYRRGAMSARQAWVHAGTEAATGAASAAAGVCAAAGLIAVTGGIGAPVVFAVAAAGSMVTKMGLMRAIRGRQVAVTAAEPAIAVATAG